MSDNSTEFEKTSVFQSQEALFEEGHLKMSLFQAPEGSKLEKQKLKNKKRRAAQREGHYGRKSHSYGNEDAILGQKGGPEQDRLNLRGLRRL
mgnify:CR=1 FL=1